MTRARSSATLPALVLATLGPAGWAQPSGSPALTGSASLGARSLDVDGTEAKFREDLDLDKGLRLFDLELRYEPTNREDARLDRLELAAAGLGGEPFESIRFGVRKYGAYRLALDRRRSRFYYDDTILPAALASVPGSTGGDYHRFDFERVRDSAELDVDLTPATQLSFGLERQTRAGGSTTTLTVERDEFDLDRPLDETSKALTFGVRHAWRRVTLVIAEELRDFENTSELVLSGASLGRNSADGSTLAFFTRDQSYDYRSRGHSVRALASPTERLDIAALWHRENLDLEVAANEQSLGTTFAGAPLAVSSSGDGDVGRDIEVDEIEIGFGLTERLRLVGTARRSTLDQDGVLAFSADGGASDWTIRTNGVEAGVEWALTAALTVAAGASTEERDADYDWVLGAAAAARRSDTERDGYFARLALATEGGWQLTASAEDDSIDAPYALASATDSRRYRIGARRRWDNGVSLTANYRRTDVENDDSGWLADTQQGDVRILYGRDGLQVSAGYTRTALARVIDQRVMAGARALLYVIDYETAAMQRDASVRWQLSRRFAVGADVRSYDAHGSVRLTHDDLRGYGEIALGPRYALQLVVRDVDYAEDAFDAYDASILEAVLRLRW